MYIENIVLAYVPMCNSPKDAKLRDGCVDPSAFNHEHDSQLFISAHPLDFAQIR